LGAKGLSAAYVFIIGFNDGYFPQNAKSITDEEICKLLVGLSRTRKECHIVSCGRFAEDWLSESKFTDWLRPHLEEVKVDKELRLQHVGQNQGPGGEPNAAALQHLPARTNDPRAGSFCQVPRSDVAD
jgi:superfamily I DNA/RNA helicase